MLVERVAVELLKLTARSGEPAAGFAACSPMRMRHIRTCSSSSWSFEAFARISFILSSSISTGNVTAAPLAPFCFFDAGALMADEFAQRQ